MRSCLGQVLVRFDFERLVDRLNLENMMRSRAGGDKDSGGLTGSFPSTQTEKLRRKIYSDIEDISFYFRSQMSHIKSNEEAEIKFKQNFDNRIKYGDALTCVEYWISF